ncbi:MAG TPA: VOC family protein [Chloroflexia bacterium]|nr:VOC family protein [Chloroflexia bacterium]
MGLLYGVQHVTITIEEGSAALETARKFYADVLGLQVLPRPESTDNGRPGWWLSLGPSGQQVHISTERGAKDYNGPSKRHSAFLVKDLAALGEQLQKNGVTVEGTNQFEGQTRFFCRDPFGNRLEFVQLT